MNKKKAKLNYKNNSYDVIEEGDFVVGELMKKLENQGMADNTLVIFTSDNGPEVPTSISMRHDHNHDGARPWRGVKRDQWEGGHRVPFIARWPGKIAQGQRTDAMVQYADVLPTLLALGGGKGKDLDGTSFDGVLLGKKTKHRAFTYGMHNNIPEGPPYPTRTVFDGEYRYTINLTPGELYIEKHLMGLKGNAVLNNPYWSTWVRDSWNKPKIYSLVKRYQLRPPEALYHTASDPYEMNNLATNPDHESRKKTLGKELRRWMKVEGDPGAKLDTMKAHSAAREGKHLF